MKNCLIILTSFFLVLTSCQNKQSSFLIKEIKKLTPMNKMNNPKNIFGILSFLAGDQSSFITGQNILVDGGKSII